MRTLPSIPNQDAVVVCLANVDRCGEEYGVGQDQVDGAAARGYGFNYHHHHSHAESGGPLSIAAMVRERVAHRLVFTLPIVFQYMISFD